MKVRQQAVVIMAIALTQACASLAQVQGRDAPRLPMAPKEDRGQSVIGALEGWYTNPDGTHSFLIGYYNRNHVDPTDIPIGPDNNIEPGGPDMGQPTHFLPGRGWGVFIITVPKDFGNKQLVWTLTANGQTTTTPLDLNSAVYEVNPFSEIGMGNTPPILTFDEGGPKTQGPVPLKESLTAKVGVPLTLDAWVSDDAKTFPGAKPPTTPAVEVVWEKYRGPADPKFANAHPPVERMERLQTKDHPFAGKATTQVTFTEPGDYVLEVTLNDWSGVGGHGFVCCWTDGQVKVSVKP